MGKKHDENKDLKSISRIAFIDYSNKTIRIASDTQVGIRRLGALDFLTKYCGWFVNIAAKGTVYVDKSQDYKPNVREAKKARKAPKLQNKNKRS